MIPVPTRSPIVSSRFATDAWARKPSVGTKEGSWWAGGVSYPRATQVGDDMLREAASLMERATQDPLNHLYIA